MAHKVYKVKIQPGPAASTEKDIKDVLAKIDAAAGTVVAEIVVGGSIFITAKLP